MFNNEKERFALRKLTVGLTSVMIGVSLISIQNSEVKADTTGDKPVQKVAEKTTTDVLLQQEKVVQTVPVQNKPVETTESEKTPQMVSAQAKQVADAQDAGQIKTPSVGTPIAATKDATDTANQTGVIKQENALNVKTNKIAMTAEMANANKVDSTANVKNYTPDVTAWTGQVVSNKDIDGITRTYYELTGYRSNNDSEKATIIIPNQDDFTKAGINIGYQTMIKSDTIKNLNKTLKPEEWHFSDTDEKKTKLMGVAGTYNDNIQNKEIPCQYSAGGLFYGSLNLKAVTGNGLDTSNVDNLSGAFSSDNKLVDISGVSNWDVSNVLSLANLFTNDESLSSLDALVNWNTSKNTSLESAFAYMPSLKSIEGLRNWDTSNVTNMRAAFQAEYTRNVDLPDPRGTKVSWSNYDLPTRWTSNLKDYSPLSNWNTSNVRDMSMMFQSSAVSDATFLTNWDTHNVENIYAMFMLNNLSDVTPFAKWNLTGIKNHAINEVFRDNMIIDLTPLRNWNVSQGENLSCTFNSNNIRYADFTQIKAGHIDVGSQRINRGIIVVKDIPDNVDMMKEDGDNDLSDQLRYYNSRYTPNSAYFSSNGNNNIQISNGMDFIERQDYGSTAGKIDICQMPVYYTSKATTTDGVKQDVRQQILKNIHTKLDLYRQVYNLPATKDIVPVTPLDQITDLADLSNAYFKVVDRTLPELDANDDYALNAKNGLHEHKNVNDNGGYDVDTWGTLDISKFTVVKDGTNLEITGYNGDPKNIIIPNIADFWAKGKDQGCLAVEISSDTMKKIVKNAVQIGLSKSNNEKVIAKDTDWYDAFGGGTNKPGETDNRNGGLYIYNPNLIRMDLHNLNTSRIVTMNSMFNGARNVTTLGDLSQWDTSHVNNMEVMFQFCEKISDLGNLDNWATGNVTKMDYMFNNMFALTNLGDLSRWDTTNVTDMSHMFSEANKLSNIGNLNTWQTGNVTNMSDMFNNMYALTNLGDLSKWDTSKVTDMRWMFSDDKKLPNIGNLNTWQTGNVQNMRAMFNECNALTNIGDLSNWNTSNVTNMQFMFYDCYLLNTVGNLSQWNTSNVTSMYCMFAYCNSIITLGNLNKWDTHNVTDMQWMFANMDKLESIGDISNWNVSNVTNMSTMFQADSQLTHIGDLSHWDTSKVTAMDYMFFKNTSLKDLNISNWDLSYLTDRNTLKDFMYGDKNLTVIANNIKLPSWYNNELDNGDLFWSDHMAIITNNDSLLKTTEVEDSILDYFDNSKLWYMTDGRPIFYQSNGSNDVIAVLNKANEEYIANYIRNHPGYGMELADNVDKADPISLANANFITIDVPLTITFVDKTDKDKTVPATLTISGQGTYTLTIPTDYELVGTLPTMYYGQNYTIEVKHVIDHNSVNDNATRTFILHLPDKTTKTIVQTIGLTRQQDYDRVIKKIISQTPWAIVANTSNVTVDGKVDNSYKAFEENTDHIRFASITLPKMPGYKPVIHKNATNPAMLMISFIALPSPVDKPQVPNTPAVINKPDKTIGIDNNNKIDWHIDQKRNTKINYVVTNDQTSIKLPKLENQALNLIKMGDYTLAFSYLKLNRLNSLIFSVKYNKHGYVLEVLDDDGKAIKTYHFKTYKGLTKELIKLNK